MAPAEDCCLAEGNLPSQSALASLVAASIRTAFPPQDRDCANDGFHSPGRPPHPDAPEPDSDTRRVLGDIEQEVSDLDRRKACFDSLNQLPFVIECRHVDRIFKGRLRNKEKLFAGWLQLLLARPPCCARPDGYGLRARSQRRQRVWVGHPSPT